MNEFASDKYIKDLAAKIEAWEKAEHVSVVDPDKYEFYLQAVESVLECCEGVSRVDPPTGNKAQEDGAMWSRCELHVWCDGFKADPVTHLLAGLDGQYQHDARLTVEPAYDPGQIVVSLVVSDVFKILR